MRRHGIAITAHALCRLGSDFEDDSHLFEETLAELFAGVAVHLVGLDTVRFKVRKELWAKAPRVTRSLLRRRAMPFPSDIVLVFEAKTTAREPFPLVPASEASFTLEGIREFAMLDTVKFIQDLFFAANVARPGSVQLLASHVSVGTFTGRGTTQYPHDWALLRYRSSVGDWPPLELLTLTETWTWLRGLPGFDVGFSRDAVGRAVQALSHLLEPVERPVEMLWTLAGLEALFTGGETGLSQQLRDRSVAFVGGGTPPTKLIREMYRTRSKFVHGKMNFAGASHYKDAADEYEAYDMALIEALDTAKAMLIASVQRLISRNLRSLDFVAHPSGYAAHPSSG